MKESAKLQSTNWVENVLTQPDESTDLSNILFKLSKKLELTQSELQNIRSQAHYKEVQIQTLEFRNEELAKKNIHFEEKTSQNLNLKSQLTQTEAELQKIIAEKEALEAKIANLQNEALEQNDTQLKLQNQIVFLTEKSSKTTAENEQLENTVHSLTQRLNFAEKQSNKVPALETQVRQQQYQNDELNLKVRAQDSQIFTFERQVASFAAAKEKYESQLQAKEQMIQLMGTQIHEFKVKFEAQESNVKIYKEQSQSFESKLVEEQKLKDSLYVTIIQQIEKRLSVEEKRNLLASSGFAKVDKKNQSSEEEALEVIRQWMIRISE